MTHRLTAATLLLLCACDTGKSTPDDPEDSTGEPAASTGAATDSTGEPSTGDLEDGTSSTGEPVEDFGREATECVTKGASAPCQTGGVAGIEVCLASPYLDTQDRLTWSACLTETCTGGDSERACDGGGLQYCVGLELTDAPKHRRWGVCNDADACKPGDIDICGTLGNPEVACLRDGQGGMRYDDCGFTPLVLSFGDTLEFSPAPARALDFSLQGPHACARADWPAPATPWLALDRDGSGSIDDGRELFGSGSVLASGCYARHGFAALAELDSDGDGAITPADATWSSLVLWSDHDADRRSSGWELLPLTSFEIEAIDLGYHSTRDCDARGNCGVERSAFRYRSNGHTRHGEVIDVHLTCE